MKKLEVRNLSFEYKENTKTLDEVSFSASMGEFVCILGHNGSGKSTLAKLIMGLLKPISGEILIDGVILNEETVEDLRGKLGIVFQNPDNQFVGITVKDDIAFGLENRNIKRSEMLARIEKYSKQIGIEHLLNRNPESLSGGEKQKVAIAGILACEPDIIIFDESTSMLDPKGTKEINETIKDLCRLKNKTIITITHNIEEAVYADRIIVLNKGNVVLDGKPIDVLREKDILVESGLTLIDSIDIINDIQDNPKYKEVVDKLWELTFKM